MTAFSGPGEDAAQMKALKLVSFASPTAAPGSWLEEDPFQGSAKGPVPAFASSNCAPEVGWEEPLAPGLPRSSPYQVHEKEQGKKEKEQKAKEQL